MDIVNMDSCGHEEIVDGCCFKCGLTISESDFLFTSTYTSLHGRVTPNSHLGFEKDLALIDIPEEIKSWILAKVGAAPKKTHRMGCRVRILFAYIYIANLQIGYNFMPEELIEKTKIQKKLITKALQLSSGIDSIQLPQGEGDIITAPLVVITPISYLMKYLEPINLENHYDNVKQLAEKALLNDEFLYEISPKWVAIAIIKCYIDFNSIDVPNFYRKFKSDASSIKKCIIKVRNALSV